MCVIIYKKRGYELPSKNFLLRAWLANPDGAGFAYNDNINVHYNKGFTCFKDFYKALTDVNTKSNLRNNDVVIHFRIATSGGVTPQKTHPFEITSSYKKMEALQGTCKNVFFHNGVMSDFASTKYSDTQNYCAMILSTIKDLERQPVLIDYLARKENSKFAIMTKNSVILGNDFLTDGNMIVSNKNYTYYYNTSYNNFEKTKYNSNTYDKKQTYIYDDYNRDYDIYY